jgi:hypothetical protein
MAPTLVITLGHCDWTTAKTLDDTSRLDRTIMKASCPMRFMAKHDFFTPSAIGHGGRCSSTITIISRHDYEHERDHQLGLRAPSFHLLDDKALELDVYIRQLSPAAGPMQGSGVVLIAAHHKQADIFGSLATS